MSSVFTAEDLQDLTLVFKVAFGGDTRRVTYPSGRLCSYEGLRGTVERLFSLSASPFYVVYTDDDGDETAIKSDEDLSEAVAYFQSGDDDMAMSSGASSYSSSTAGSGMVTMRVQVVVEYDGPSLSDTASIAESFDDTASYDGFGDERSDAGESFISGSYRSGSGTSNWDDFRDDNRNHRISVAPGTGVVIEHENQDYSYLHPQRPISTGPHPLSQAQYPTDESSSASSASPSGTLRDPHSFSNFVAGSPINASSGSPPSSDGELCEDDAHGSTSSTRIDNTSHRQKKRTKKREQIPMEQAESDYYTQPHPIYQDVPFSGRRSQQRSHSGTSGRSDSNNTILQPFEALRLMDEEESGETSSGLEQSELGSRWLREQGERLAKKVGPPASKSSSSRSGRSSHSSSKRQSLLSGDDSTEYHEGNGDLALEQDDRGNWYYNYMENGSISSFSHEQLPYDGEDQLRDLPSSFSPYPYQQPQQQGSSSSLGRAANLLPHPRPTSFTGTYQSSSDAGSLTSNLIPTDTASLSELYPDIPSELLEFTNEPAAPPKFAPNCSGCGSRLDYMRYSCLACGDCELHEEGEEPQDSNYFGKGKNREGHQHHSHGHDDEDDDGYASDSTEMIRPPGSWTASSSNSRRSQISLQISAAASDSVFSESASSITGASSLSPTSPATLPGGYELCVSCIELRGQEHSRSFRKSRRAATLLSPSSPSSTTGLISNSRSLSFSGGNVLKVKELSHAFRERVWGDNYWKDVEYDDPSNCSICNNDLSVSRFKCVSCQKFDLCRTCFQKVEEIHPIHAFLSVPDRPSRAKPPGNHAPLQISTPAAPRVEHPGAFCHNCLRSIVGVRFHCAQCASWDLCEDCDGLPITGDAANGAHQPDHIMMKIPVPLGIAEVEQVSRRAREQWTRQSALLATGSPNGSRTPSATGRSQEDRLNGPVMTLDAYNNGSRQSNLPRGLVRPPYRESPSIPQRPVTSRITIPSSILNFNSGLSHVFNARNGLRRTPPIPQVEVTPQYPPPLPRRSSVDHNTRCSNCSLAILGTRYQCACCPSDPVAYNLCSSCERSSYLVHNPLHVFLRFERPVDFPVKSHLALLPPLYVNPAGSSTDPDVSAGMVHAFDLTERERDPTHYLKYLYHPSTLCDGCVKPITGVWFRCANCSSFDVCSDCDGTIDHSEDHVFVVFKSDVNMQTLKNLGNFGQDNTRPLIHQRAYASS